MLHGITKNILNFKDRLVVAKSNGKNHDKMNNDLNSIYNSLAVCCSYDFMTY